MTQGTGDDTAEASNTDSDFTTSPDTQSGLDKPERKLAKTIIEGMAPNPADEPPGKKIAKTLLETPVAEADTVAEQPDNANKRALGMDKTILEGVGPELNTDARKVAKTMLDVSDQQLSKVGSLGPTGMSAAIKMSSEQLRMPMKISKSFTQPLAGITEAVLASAQLEKTAKTDSDSIRGERFVARTMLDHTVLAETLSRSAKKEKLRAEELAKERANEPVKEFHQVDSKKLAAPCAWSWPETDTKTRVQACGTCRTQVYNFTGMELPEAEALIFTQENRKKFSLFKRADGKFMTRDCPVQIKHKRDLVLMIVIGSLVTIGVIAAMLVMPPPPKPPASAAEDNTADKSPPASDRQAPTSDSDGSFHYRAGKPMPKLPVSNPVPLATPPINSTEEESKYWEIPPGGEIEVPQIPAPTVAPAPTVVPAPTVAPAPTVTPTQPAGATPETPSEQQPSSAN